MRKSLVAFATAALALSCGPAPQRGASRERATLRAENAWEAARARLMAPGGLSLARRLAQPRPGDGDLAAAAAEWGALGRGLAQGARPEAPLLLDAAEEEGTDLFRPDQGGFVRETYLVRVAADEERAAAWSAELQVAPAPADVGAAPPPALLLVADPDAPRLLAFPLRAAPLLSAAAALWDGAAAIERAAPYGALPPRAVLRREGNAAWWPGRRLLEPSGRELRPASAAPAHTARFGTALTVGAPNGFGPRAASLAGYAAFASRVPRRAVVYAADEEGWLHAFDAASGAEAFALKVGAPGRPAALSFDDAYVDAPWASGGEPCPAPFAPGRACQWRTLLAVRSAEGLTLLDVTQPDVEGSSGSVPDCLAGDALPAGCSAPWPALVFARGAAEESLSPPAFGRVRWRAPGGAVVERSVLVSGRAEGGVVMRDAGTGETLGSVTSGLSGASPRAIAPVDATPAAVDLDGDGLLDAIWFGDRRGALWRARAPRGALPLAADLVFDGGADPRAAGPIALPPAVFRLGGETWIAFAAGPAVVALPDRPRAVAPAELAWLTDASPALGGCGAAPPRRESGWALALASGEEVRALLVLSGYVRAASTGRDGETRLRRLAAGTGDPCAGVDCCGSGAALRSRAALPFAGAAARPLAMRAALDEEGALRLFLAAGGGGPLRLHAPLLPVRTALLHPRSR